MTKQGAVFCLSAILWSCPAMAGFEFMPGAIPAPAQAAVAAPMQMQAPRNTGMTPEPSMPVLPAEPVTREMLPPITDRVLPNNVSRGQPAQTYTSTTTQIPIPAPAGQPFDSEALLDAAVLGQPLELAPQKQKTPSIPQEEYIAINPFPLQDSVSGAIHGGQADNAILEQGMMEDSGALRPVALPGGRKARPTPSAPSQQSAAPSQNYDAIEQVALTPPPRKPPPPAIEAAPTPKTANYTEAVGFGRELPLALALSQVVPPGYTYSFGQNVDAGAAVSWQGGKPWNDVLNDMLAPSGMHAKISGNQVVIESART